MQQQENNTLKKNIHINNSNNSFKINALQFYNEFEDVLLKNILFTTVLFL